MTSPREVLQPGDAVLVVDVQNDFCQGGALEVPDGDSVVPVLNQWIEAALAAGVPVVASRCWHPVEHVSFQTRGGPWPPHCVQGSPGAAFHPALHLPEAAIVVTKGVRFDKDQYSVFDETGLAEELSRRGVRRLWVGGLAEDVCVAASALDGRAAGFDVTVIAEATRPVTPEGGEEALERLREKGVGIAA